MVRHGLLQKVVKTKNPLTEKEIQAFSDEEEGWVLVWQMEFEGELYWYFMAG